MIWVKEKAKRNALPFAFVLAGDTGALDTLDDVSLHEGVENQQGEQNQNTTSIADSGNVHVFARILGIQGLGHLDDIGHQGGSADGVEHFGVEVIRPLPGECEHEDRDQHGHRQGKNDLEEGSEHAGAVQICGLFQFIRNALEELTEHEDVQSVLECQAGGGHDDQRPHGVQQTDGGIRQDVDPFEDTAAQQIEQTADFANLEDIEVTELHKHGQLDRGMRNDHRKDNQKEQKTVTLESKLRETVTNHAANEGLQNSAGSGEEQRIQEGHAVAVVSNDGFVGAESRLFGDQTNRYVYEVAGTHEGGRDLRIEREQDYVGNTEQEQELEKVNQDLLEEEGVYEFRLQTFHQRSTFKVHTDAILGFLGNFGSCFNMIHKNVPPFLVFSLVEHECTNQTGYSGNHQDDNEEVHPGHGRCDRVTVSRRALGFDILHDGIARRCEGVDDRIHGIYQDHRAYHGKGDLPEGFPSARAVDGAGLVDGRGDGLQSGEEDQHLYTGAVDDVEDVVNQLCNILNQLGTDHHIPEQQFDIHDGHDLGHLALAGTGVNAFRVAHVVGEGVGGVDLCNQTGGQKYRDEEDRTERCSSGDLAIQQDRNEQREDNDSRNVQNELGNTFAQFLYEVRVYKESVAVILKANPIQLETAARQHADIVEAVLDGVVDDRQIQQQETEDKGHYEPPASTCFSHVQRCAALFLSTGRGEQIIVFHFCTHYVTPLSQSIRTKPRASMV